MSISLESVMTDTVAENMESTNFEEQALVHLDALYSAALRLTRSPSSAEDLVQEAVLRAWKNWHCYQSGTNCRAWLFRIQMNTFINGYRRTRTERGFMDSKTDGTLADKEHLNRRIQQWSNPERSFEHRNLSAVVTRALSKLKPEFRTVVVMSDLKDMSYKEISEEIEVPIGTVMSRLFRARRSLRDLLTDHARTYGLAAA
jgi:RNA polymerase sigma-70 factor (ECF subfamily)